jgi:mono/diheme cytochrome c family protein
MKKPVKIVLLALAAIVLLIVIFVVYVNVAGIPSYENKAPELSVAVTDARVEEGSRIAATLCMGCHGSNDGKLGGGYMYDAVDFGEIYSANITRHPEYGITDYTDGELAYLLRTGIKKDGGFVPYMPLFPKLSDEDLYSIIAFLHSDNPMVQPSDNQPPKPRPNMLAKMLSRTVMKPLPYPDHVIEAPSRDDKVAYGRYLAVAKFDCFSCHSASFKTMNIMEPEQSEGFMGGGNTLYDKEMNVIKSSNLTMDKETGLGDWSEEEFIKTLRYGMKPDGSILKYPMTPRPMITDEEASDIWAYLQTVPKIHNKVE